ncbi:hypothetical protein F0L17_12145 [Streptomyces sp. TRM43335]|uniref:Ricin B lectin domain-containing protein n=1 Tax=Streptomyces taklimakanensis TaxID=2569853 RepID=A0A6G2BCR5_9ACTN|nr:ricin-type beta-trefoil lectin domain protein [Streptomyces taklimakanensis]MTE19853.1 hypothetical protein [Streptomyces taklimakanensis]
MERARRLVGRRGTTGGGGEARGRRTRAVRGALAAVAALTTLTGLLAAAPAAATDRPAARRAVPLPPELEEIRAEWARALYGDPAPRPVEERKTALISLGDSEISGEGVGTYEPGTDGPDNWCHRSPDAAVHRTGIPVDVTYNVACSGASTDNVRIGGRKQYADELVQSDSLAIAARTTRLSMVLLVVGANDDLRFGPVMTDCVARWFLLRGPCAPTYADGWQARIDGLVPKVERTARDLRTVMREAGYADDDYRLVLLGYPGPIGPDVRDNPHYRGKLPGGCTVHDEDARWARDHAVPLFATGMREAARRAGVTFLDASRLFHGHEVCMEAPRARGLWVDPTNPFPPDFNSVRQSFHPNHRGHGAFAACLTRLHGTEAREASCADAAGTGSPALYAGAWDDHFAPLRNVAWSTCLGVDGTTGRNGTPVRLGDCDGGRHQGWWYDAEQRALHVELTHDRCVDVPGGRHEAGVAVRLYDCHGGAGRRFVRDGDTLRPEAARELCLTAPGPRETVRLRPCDGSDRQRFVREG